MYVFSIAVVAEVLQALILLSLWTLTHVLSVVTEVFDAFCKSAEMNPADDDDEDDGWICDEDEVADGARAAHLAARFDAMLGLDEPVPESGQFDDADEDSLL